METMLEIKTIPYNLRNLEKFVTQRNRTLTYGLESVSNQLSQLSTLVPDEYEQINSLNQFTSNLKNWICRLCKKFASNLGFL